MNNRNLKFVLLVIWVLASVAVGGAVAGVWLLHRHDVPRGSPQAMVYADPPTSAAAGRLPDMYDAAEFRLTDQSNHPFDSRQLHGKVWVADFVFTGCTSICPLMTQDLYQFQQQTAGTGIEMVSFSVDPQNDTPAALTTYAKTNQADLSRWHFLTGDKDAIWQVSNTMKLAVGPGDNHQIMHDSHFLLVDRQGKVRSIYDSRDAGFLKRMTADAIALAQP